MRRNIALFAGIFVISGLQQAFAWDSTRVSGITAGPDPNSSLYAWLFGTTTLFLVATLAAIRFHSVSTRLRETLIEHEKAQKALRESELLHRSILQAMPDGIVITSLDGTIRSASPSILKTFGYEKSEDVLGKSMLTFLVPEERERAMQNVALMFQGIYTGPADYRALRADGSIFYLEANAEFIPNAEGDPTGIVFIDRDVTERKCAQDALAESNRRLSELSTTDSLTGIANRRRFDEVLQQEHARHARTGGELALILLDIDHFKQYNDHYGHVEGDYCLQQIARVLAECTQRPADIAARYGGEEFACILPETSQSGALQIAERIRRQVQELAIPHEHSQAGSVITVSLGVASIRCATGQDPRILVLQADQFLYQAKNLGRNQTGHGATEPRGNHLVQIHWLDDYNSGNSLIDSQHQTLFLQANELLSAILDDWDPSTIHSRIARLTEDLKLHFHDEERLLAAAGYHQLEEHSKEHTRLLERAQVVAQQYQERQIQASEIFFFLAHTVVRQHMLAMDREYFSCLS